MCHHVARFIRCKAAQILRGFLSVDDIWDTRESLNTVGMANDALPQAAYIDIQRCLHFSDNWDDDSNTEWSDSYLDERDGLEVGAAHHCQKFCVLEDSFNTCYKRCVEPGEKTTFDKS